MKGERLSNRQIATLKHLAICCANGGQVALTRDQREAMVPLWHRDLIEIWYRHVPAERQRGPFFRPTEFGWRLIDSILATAAQRLAEAA